MKIKYLLPGIAICAALGLAGCGKKEPAPPAATPGAPAADAAQQEQASAVMFQRTMARATSLVAQKDFAQATATLKQLDGLKLTPAQQTQVDALKAQIPAK